MLMKDRTLHKITIKDICENADINRSTFYAYYADQYDLLQQIEDEIFDETQKNLQYTSTSLGPDQTILMLEGMMNFILKNAEVCKLLLGERGDFEFQKKLMGSILEHCLNIMANEKKWDQKTKEYIYLFMVSGSMGLIQNWMHNDLDRTPKEMSEMIMNLTNKGIEAYF